MPVDTAPTLAENDSASVFTVDGYSDAEGTNHVVAAGKAVDVAEALDASWESVERRFVEASAASDAVLDHDDLEATRPIHAAFRAAREALMASAAPNWGGVATKAAAFLQNWGATGFEKSRYVAAAQSLLTSANSLAEGPAAEADPIRVMAATGYAEQVCYYLANDPDGYANWAVGRGNVPDLARDAEGLASDIRALVAPFPVQHGLSAEVRSAVWFGQSAILNAMGVAEQPQELTAKYHEATRTAELIGTDLDAAFATGSPASPSEKEAVNERYEAAMDAADGLLQEIIDRPASTVAQLAEKYQLAFDRWFFGSVGETLTDPAFVHKITSERDAERWIIGRIFQDLRRLSGGTSAQRAGCDVDHLSDDFANAIRTHDALDTKKGLTPSEVTALAQADHDLTAVPNAVFELTPASRSGVAFQLLAAMGQLDIVQHAVSDDADRAADCIRTAVANAIRVLGLPFDHRTAEFFTGGALGDLDGANRPGPAR